MAKYGFLALPSAIIAFAGDLRNKEDLEKIFSRTQFDVVIHFAGLKAVWESVANPRRYFDNNLIGTINYNEVMAKYDCKKECNLMPYIQKVAVGRLPELNVYGHDYPTKDGGAVRDYIHVMDLADGHIAALRKLLTKEDMGDHSSLHTNLYVNEFSVTC